MSPIVAQRGQSNAIAEVPSSGCHRKVSDILAAQDAQRAAAGGPGGPRVAGFGPSCGLPSLSCNNSIRPVSQAPALTGQAVALEFDQVSVEVRKTLRGAFSASYNAWRRERAGGSPGRVQAVHGPEGKFWAKPAEPDEVKAFTSQERKRFYALQQNIEHAVDLYGRERVGFLTLTFSKENKTWDYKEASRRFNSVRTNLLGDLFLAYVAVKECHKDGSLHFHLVVITHERITCNHDEVAEGNYKSANRPLKRLWAILRQRLNRYKFARHELLPVRRNAQAISFYVAKYLSKNAVTRRDPERGVNMKHARLVIYSQGFPRKVKGVFSWVGEGATYWRYFVKRHCETHGIQDFGEITKREGRYWGFRLSLQFAELRNWASVYKPDDPARFLAGWLGLPAHLWPERLVECPF